MMEGEGRWCFFENGFRLIWFKGMPSLPPPNLHYCSRVWRWSLQKGAPNLKEKPTILVCRWHWVLPIALAAPIPRKRSEFVSKVVYRMCRCWNWGGRESVCLFVLSGKSLGGATQLDKYEGSSKINENVGSIWAQGVQSGNTAQWYKVHTRGYQKYKFQLNRIETRSFVIICVKHIRAPHSGWKWNSSEK